MEKIKNIVLCCSMDEILLQQLHNILAYPFPEETRFHFIHVFKVQLMMNDLTPFVFPSDEQQESIRRFVQGQLQNLRKQLGLHHTNSVEECFFDSNPRKRILEYLDEVGADLVVATTRPKHGMEGLFSSSFTDHLVKLAKCDCLILRP